MRRRLLLQSGVVATMTPLVTGPHAFAGPAEAIDILRAAVDAGAVESATLFVSRDGTERSVAFGKAASPDAMFLLGSISKPIAMTALMRLHEQGQFSLDDPVHRFLPHFTGDSRENVTIRHLLTHVSGLPDQLPENQRLRATHAPLSAFVEDAQRQSPGFPPGSAYRYSSMGILLASAIAERISGLDIRQLVQESVLTPLGMRRSAQGIGHFAVDDFVRCQTERAAPESGGGADSAKDWDWNSRYWRTLGAPWGGTHASAPDVGRFLVEFLPERGTLLAPETARLMVRNHNPAGLTPRGLGFAVGPAVGGARCSPGTFGHTGSTGTLCWADPETRTTCVVLTSLPAGALNPHPRDRASDLVATSANR